ncbi:MAG: GntR family transcriptional regulator [Beutenbergiaceae bacterium]
MADGDTDGASSPRTVRPGLLVETAIEHLRQEILSGGRQPGQRVQESVLARDLGMSRAPVREALRVLAQSGLLVKNPNQSYTVRAFTDEDLYELATLRINLESFAARLAFDTPETRERLEEPLRALRRAEDDRDAGAAFHADQQFHRALVQSAHHSRLLRSYDGLTDEIELALRSNDRARPSLAGITERHLALARGFEGGSVETLVQDLTEHIRAGSGLSHLAMYLSRS